MRLLLGIFGQCGDGMTKENIFLVFWPSELHSVLQLVYGSRIRKIILERT